MSESVDKNKSGGQENDNSAETDSNKGVVLDLDFAPSWARTSPEDHIKSVKSSRFESDGGGSYNRRSNNRDNRRGKSDSRFSRNDRENRKFERNKPPRRREFSQDRPAANKPHGGDSRSTPLSAGTPHSAHNDGGFNNRGNESRPPRSHGNYRGRPRIEHPPLPLEVRVLPEQKALGGVIRRIQSSHRAFPLRDIAWLFLDKPASCLVRLAQQKEEQVPLYQCKICGMPALSEEEIENHLINRHLDESFDVEEVECETPGGKFVCVMRCGITGTLLGPPNHHSYNTKVYEMLRTKFPNMSEEVYRRKIESVRESEVIEEWRQSCTKKNIYRRKDVQQAPVPETPKPEADVDKTQAEPPEGDLVATLDINEEDNEIKSPPMEREVAELVFKREVMPKQYSSVKHMICIASTALQTPNKQLYFAIKDMLHKERRFPTSLFFALRGAFRHRKLFLFRANEAKGPDFVMQKKPAVLDPSHAVDLVKDVLSYIQENPACTKVELVQALSGDDKVKIKETLSQLAWLIEKGNVIEYYNDVLSAPIEFPSFRLLPGEKKRGRRGDSVAVADPAIDKVKDAAVKKGDPDPAKSMPAASAESDIEKADKPAAKPEKADKPAAKPEKADKPAAKPEKKAAKPIAKPEKVEKPASEV